MNYKIKVSILILTIIFLINLAKGNENNIYPIKADSREKLFLTIYNFNLGLIKEIRNVKIPLGDVILRFEDVPSKIDPTTISVRSLSSPEAFKIKEQKYEFNLLNRENLLKSYLGKEVILISVDPETKKEIRQKAILLSISGGEILKIDNRVVMDFPGRIEFPELPKNLLLAPALKWKVKNNYSGKQKLEISYLTEGLTWKSFYNAVIKENKITDLTALINIENKSGTDFEKARIKLIAGEIQKLRPERVLLEARPAYVSKAFTQEIKEEEFFEYYIYSLPYLIDLHNNETKQFLFFKANKIPIRKKYVVEGQRYYYTRRFNVERKEKINVYLHIENNKENNLGLALPSGIFRVYNEDKDGHLHFIGEDRIKHTPEGEIIKLRIGKAFDISAIRKQTDYRKISKEIHESTFEIKINNLKNKDIEVEIREPVSGEWEVIKSNYPYEKIDIYNLKFIIPVKKKSYSILKYTIRVKY
ncbi:DUF4139 domain-containing protein [SCandidatus Aminicenantes bacterium Aminicenantia_JdfR_composite]|jgi:hypothetical protein|nr:DUF4139 domain-containing protein [SCandidatus Aminicenantes bacterium Aminicenantia_JdfR_composite]MCP2597153.1 DUF4139 domain-containing protein [Candidatus Aminicenantes bacterium AC-335-G13]